MKQQSPFIRYHRNWQGLTHSSNPSELYLQTKTSDFEATAPLANIYLQSLQEPEPVGSSGKKERKIKVFGIPENRIRRDEYIPDLFDRPPQRETTEERDQMLIDSHLHIATATLLDEPAPDSAETYDDNQLQKLLYCSGFSAPPEAGPESMRTEEVEVGVPSRAGERESSSILPSRVPSRLNFALKNTDSSYLAEEKAKESQVSRLTGKNSCFLKAVEEGERDMAVSAHQEARGSAESGRGSAESGRGWAESGRGWAESGRGWAESGREMGSRDEESKILQMREYAIAKQHLPLQLNAISPIPIKYEQIMQASIQYDPQELRMLHSPKQELKIPYKPAVPCLKKERPAKDAEHLNIKNYLESYGSYEQQVEKMINKLEKVSDLKDKEKVIKRELQTLTHKKHQSASSIDHQPQGKAKSHKAHQPCPPTEKQSPRIFAQSASNFLPRGPEEIARNSIDRELHKDVAKMEIILSKFKEISQIISTDGTHLEQREPRHQRSEKKLRGANYYDHMMFQSEKLGVESLELPNYSCKQVNSQPQIQLKIPEKMQAALDDSQEIGSENGTYKARVRVEPSRNAERPILPQCANTVRTEKKPLYGLAQRCESRYNLELHTEKECECSHTQLAQEIAKLSQKVQDLQKEKVKQAQSLESPSHQRGKGQAEDEGSVHEESSCFELPKQIEESIQSIKEKIGKKNQHLCSNLRPVSILKPNSALKQHTSTLKTEEAKPSPTLTKRKNSKDLPPKPKNVSKSPQMKKDAIAEGQFSDDIDVSTLKLGFPSIVCHLSNTSSEASIIKFGEAAYGKLFAFASGRQGWRGGKLDEKAGLKIKKYEDCIHYYLQNSLNYHLVCYFRGKLYFGQLKDTSSDCKHGFGYYSTPKYVYGGDFAADKKHGNGTINYANGDAYRGGWRNGKREGQGTMVNLAGDIFKGTFQKGKKNGKGQERLNNGDFYRGEFREGKLEGAGSYWWSDGSMYKGGFKGGLLHGHGVWRSKGNDCYEGEYRQNQKYGKGIYKWNNGMIFTGVFEADEQVHAKNSLPSPDRKNSKSGQRTVRTRQNSSKKH